MQGIILFGIFLFGLIIGSFLNCLIYRLELGKGKSILKGKSFCPLCKHPLRWLDLIPLLSFILLKARCRYCKQKISWQYPIVEIATGLVFALMFLKEQNLLHFFLFSFFWSLLLVIFVVDLKHYLIPNRIVWLFCLSVIIFKLSNYDTLWGDLALALIVSSCFFFIWLFSKGRAMGFGDVKLVFPLLLMLGWPLGLVGLFIAFLSGSLVGLILIALKKKKLKSQVPFGPFLIGGALIAFLWGSAIWQWYLQLIWATN